jgi:hypothetical protein
MWNWTIRQASKAIYQNLVEFFKLKIEEEKVNNFSFIFYYC